MLQAVKLRIGVWTEKQEAWDGGPVQITITDGMRQRLFVG
jgi:hypothetical protein